MIKVDYELIIGDRESLGVIDTEELTLSCKHFIVHFMLGVPKWLGSQWNIRGRFPCYNPQRKEKPPPQKRPKVPSGLLSQTEALRNYGKGSNLVALSSPLKWFNSHANTLAEKEGTLTFRHKYCSLPSLLPYTWCLTVNH